MTEQEKRQVVTNTLDWLQSGRAFSESSCKRLTALISG